MQEEYIREQVDASKEQMRVIQNLTESIKQQVEMTKIQIKEFKAVHRALVVVKFDGSVNDDNCGNPRANDNYKIPIVIHNIGRIAARNIKVVLPQEWTRFLNTRTLFHDNEVLNEILSYSSSIHNEWKVPTSLYVNEKMKYAYIKWQKFEPVLEEFCEKGYIDMPVTLSYESGNDLIEEKRPIEGADFVKIRWASLIIEKIKKKKAASQANPPK